MFSFLSVGLHRIVLYRGNVDDDDDDSYISNDIYLSRSPFM